MKSRSEKNDEQEQAEQDSEAFSCGVSWWTETHHSIDPSHSPGLAFRHQRVVAFHGHLSAWVGVARAFNAQRVGSELGGQSRIRARSSYQMNNISVAPRMIYPVVMRYPWR